MVAAFITAALTVSLVGFVSTAPAIAAEVPATGANLDFESGLTSWDTTGTVTVPSTGAQSGTRYATLAAGATAKITLTGLKQGSYSLIGWFRGATSNNAASVVVSGTGGPDATVLLDATLSSSAWQQTAHRNVLVYADQLTLTITAGSSPLSVDNLVLTLDSADQSVPNWSFESGLEGWTANSGASVISSAADNGQKAVKLAAGAEISREVAVEPNTRYGFTLRVKVDEQDRFSTEKIKNSRDQALGELVHRESTGDRVNVGVKTVGGAVLRQAPSGTEGYSLVSVTFETGPNDHAVVVYANTIKDSAYADSVTLWNSDGSYVEDPWNGNGSSFGYVDTANLFEIRDEGYLRGADMSFLPAIEDNGGKYFANGVQQDSLRIISNHGVNSVTTMIMVQAGNPIFDSTFQQQMETVLGDDGNPLPYEMIEGYFDKDHTTKLAERTAALGMSFSPSFHYSDGWMSAAKAYTPLPWINVDYAGTKTNSDIAHIKAVVYNYVYDFIAGLVAKGVDIAFVKQGNEQNGGLIWPVGQGATSVGHAAVIAATYDAVEAAAPGVGRSVHTNNGYDSAAAKSFFTGLAASGAKFDGESHSLYGGRSSGNIIKLATALNADPARRHHDYVNVETGFAFTRYYSSWDMQTPSMGQSSFYRSSPNGQYNWLLDYMQAAMDTPNPYGQTRGFYYWETDWIPTPGAGASQVYNASVAGRIMFNNGDVAIKEMGSTLDGKAGDMMDSMYAYLWRGLPKAKAATTFTPLSSDNGLTDGVYTVTPTVPTGITVEQASVTIPRGASERLRPTIAPVDQVLTDSRIAYTSADTAIATVTANGYIRARGVGATTVTATDAAGHTASVSVTVTAPAVATGTNFVVTAGTTVVADGGTVTAGALSRVDLFATVGGATDQSVVFTSSNPDVGSFFGETWQTPAGQMRQRTSDSSKVQLNVKKAGTTTITVSSRDGGASKSFTVNATKIPVTSVTLDKTSATVSNSRSLQLTATLAPLNATFYKIKWTSSDTSVATVDSKGLVKAVGVGTATIRAESDDNASTTATATITVVPVQVDGVVLNKSTMTVKRGTSKPLAALVLPADADNKNVTWASSDESVVTVNSAGSVTGVGLGEATIIATTVQGSFTASATVTVQADAVDVTGVVADREKYYFKSDYFSSLNPSASAPTVTLTAVVEPADATSDTVNWSSDTPSVATVNAFGIVTAVAPGVATITASSEDGRFTDNVNVYVPALSDSFENRPAGDTWGTGRVLNYAGAITGIVTNVAGDQVLNISGGGTGGRGGGKYFSPVLKNDLVVFDFDWNVGQPTSSNGAFFTINDSTESRYIAVQSNWGAELSFTSGGKTTTTTTNVPLSGTTPVGTGFNATNVWYEVHVELDMKAKQTLLIITRKDNPAITATHVVPFAADTAFTGDVASLQWWATRSGGTMAWTTMFDDVNVYKAAPVANTVKTNTAGIRFIPVTGTRMTQFQLASQVLPGTVSQEVTYTSANPGLISVDANGIVTPTTLYPSVDQIVPGTTTVRVASKADPTVYVDVPVAVSNEIRASEFFLVENAAGARVFEEGQTPAIQRVEIGDTDKLTARLTGGDGESDVANIAWESSDPSVVQVNAQTGELTAVANGLATIKLTATMYAGEPKTATIQYRVGPEPTIAALEVSQRPTKTEYQVGESFDPAGLEVLAKWTDGAEKVVPSGEYTLSGFSSAAPGTKTVTVSLTADAAKKATFDVTVLQPAVISRVAVTHQPAKAVYTADQAFDPTGLVVTATWSNGTTTVLAASEYELSGFISGTPGHVTVTVTLVSDRTKKATFAVTIVPAVTVSSFANTTLTNAFTSERGDQEIRGDLECNSQVRIAGSVRVTGNAHLTNTCRIEGSLSVGGNVTIDSTPVVLGSVTAVGDIAFQSTARVGGDLISGGTIRITDGVTRAALIANGRVGGAIRDAQTVAPVAVATYAERAVPEITKTWVQWMNAVSAAANAPTWMSGRTAAPGCTIASFSVNSSTVAVPTATVVDARRTATGSKCASVGLQAMTVSLSADLTIVADGFTTINGARFVSADGQPHKVTVLVPGVQGADAGTISLSASTIAESGIELALVAPGRVSVQNATDFRGLIYAGGGLAASGTVRFR